MKYKINQLVRIKETGYVGSVSQVDDSSYKINASDWWYQENALEPATLCEVGDILVDEKEEDVTELTLEDVAKKFKIDIDKLRIKDNE